MEIKMVQLVMVFGIGFLCAALLALALMPIAHQRAVRLTVARLDKAVPVSVQELQVEKDQMRAQVATSLRRLEIVIEHLKKTNVAHQTEITKKTERLTALEAEGADKSTAIGELQEKNRNLQMELSTVLKDRAASGDVLITAQRSLVEKEQEFGHLKELLSDRERRLAERDVIIDELRARLQKSETMIVALQNDLSVAHDRQLSVSDLHREIDHLEARIEMMTRAVTGAEIS